MHTYPIQILFVPICLVLEVYSITTNQRTISLNANVLQWLYCLQLREHQPELHQQALPPKPLRNVVNCFDSWNYYYNDFNSYDN